MQTFALKKMFFAVILATAIVVALRMLGLFHNTPPVAY